MSDKLQQNHNEENNNYNDQYALKSLCSLLKEHKAEIIEDSLSIKKYNLTIRPHVYSADERGTIMYYEISHPKWEQNMFECSVGMGNDKKQSFGMAEGSFIFGMLQDIFNMFELKESSKEKSNFLNCEHKWNVYFGNIVSIGKNDKSEVQEFWDIIKDDVLKRIGNQKICYVKIYAAKNGDYITGECRINDIAAKDISKKIYDNAKEWNVEEFSSKKQFFFLVQDDETYKAYPYTENDIKKIVYDTVELFNECVKNDNYENYYDLLGEKLEDYDLAEELYSFIPEMCAEMAFGEKITFPEIISVTQNEEKKEYYKTQIASYYPIYKALNKLDNTVMTDETFNYFISLSSAYSAIENARKQGADILKNGGTISISYEFSDKYLMR